jgi:hypothetical protein
MAIDILPICTAHLFVRHPEDPEEMSVTAVVGCRDVMTFHATESERYDARQIQNFDLLLTCFGRFSHFPSFFLPECPANYPRTCLSLAESSWTGSG